MFQTEIKTPQSSWISDSCASVGSADPKLLDGDHSDEIFFIVNQQKSVYSCSFSWSVGMKRGEKQEKKQHF